MPPAPGKTELAGQSTSISKRVRSEAALFLGLLFFGFVIMPIAIWFIGQNVFGAYGGEGYDDFFGTLSAKIRDWDGVAWFLVLSPYLAVTVLRLMAWGWRMAGRRSA